MGRLKKMAYPGENGEFIYVPKRVIDGICKKSIITSLHTEGGIGGKVIIKYEDTRYGSYGTAELFDMGPDVPKNKRKKLEEEK